MAVASVIPEGTRVRIRRAQVPLDPAVEDRVGTVVDASEYYPHRYGVLLDGERSVRYFTRDEVTVETALELAPDRLEAKQRRALP